MIRPTRRLADFEARYARDAFRDWSYAQSLVLFSAMWQRRARFTPSRAPTGGKT